MRARGSLFCHEKKPFWPPERSERLAGAARPAAGGRQRGAMREAELRRLLAANLLCAVSIVLTALVPALFLDGFSVLGTHLTWLCVCSVCVSVLNVTLCLILKPNPSSKRSSLSNKVRFGGFFFSLDSYRVMWRGCKVCHRNDGVGKNLQLLVVNSCFP